MKNKQLHDHIKTNAPKNIELILQADANARLMNHFYPGDSVNEHKNLEIANEFISGDEIKQQNENL